MGGDPGGLLIGKIKRLPLREVWKHEALDFTTWLRENVDVVSDAIGVSLEEAEREQSAGDFSVDLVARDSSGCTVKEIEGKGRRQAEGPRWPD